MLLSPDKVDQFDYLYGRLISFALQRLKLFHAKTTKVNIELTVEQLGKVREALFSNVYLIDDFIKENPFRLAKSDLDIIGNWRHFVKSRFQVVKQLKDYAVFLSTEDPPRAYGVVGIYDTVEDMAGRPLPLMVDAVLLPFDDKIIHDGLMSIYAFSFGSGLRKELNVEYEEAKSRFGIITSLPFTGEKNERSDEDLLRFYLKSEDNRDRYWGEICELANKNTELMQVFHQEMGRVHARMFRKRLKESKVRRAWFAVLEGLIIASGQTEKEAMESALRIVPEQKRDFIYIFQHKG